jgi:hypothetical protein
VRVTAFTPLQIQAALFAGSPVSALSRSLHGLLPAEEQVSAVAIQDREARKRPMKFSPERMHREPQADAIGS